MYRTLNQIFLLHLIHLFRKVEVVVAKTQVGLETENVQICPFTGFCGCSISVCVTEVLLCSEARRLVMKSRKELGHDVIYTTATFADLVHDVTVRELVS